MKKMKLDLARLSVEAFDTTIVAKQRGGTVRALNDDTQLVECTALTNCYWTCQYGCPSALPYCMPTELEYHTCGVGPRDNC